MGQQTLFGDSDDLTAPVTPVPEPVVCELVEEWGVSEVKARGFTARQAFAVRDKLRARGKKKTPPAPEPTPVRSHARAEPERVPSGGSIPERWAVAHYLRSVLAEDGVPEMEVYRVVRSSTYVLSRGELIELAGWLIGKLDGRGVDAGGDAGGRGAGS